MDNTMNKEIVFNDKLSVQNLVKITRKAYNKKVPYLILWKVFVEKLIKPNNQNIDEFLESQKQKNSNGFTFRIDSPMYYENPLLFGKSHESLRCVVLPLLVPSLIVNEDSLDFNIEGFKVLYKYIFDNFQEIIYFLKKEDVKNTNTDMAKYMEDAFNSIYGNAKGNENLFFVSTDSTKSLIISRVMNEIVFKITKMFPTDFLLFNKNSFLFTKNVDLQKVKECIGLSPIDIQYGYYFMVCEDGTRIVLDGNGNRTFGTYNLGTNR